jgi:hypothetical protein
MPRDERVLVVLVASPSDLESERTRLEEVIGELNLTWSRTFHVRLELVKWETHGYPAIGSDPQEVLNREFGDAPDIFIGLMWGRYGTPTGRAGSGTEEEFNRALARYRKDPSSVRIMFYFKDAPLSPSNIDADQLARVQRFRASLGAEGALHWKFVTLEEFERLLRIHLARQIQEFVQPIITTASAADATIRRDDVPGREDDLGLLDYLDLLEEHFSELNLITGRISSETRSLGLSMEQRTADINAATAQTHGQLSRREARLLMEKAASDMAQYVARMSAEVPLFRETLRKGADAAGRAALLSAGMDSGDRQQIRDTRVALVTFRDALSNSYDSTSRFRASVQGLPRMTAVLNKAKRETAAVLNEVLEILAEGNRMLTETLRALDALLGEVKQDA